MQWVALIICLVVILIGAVVSLVRCLRDDDCRPQRKRTARPPTPEPPKVEYGTVEPQDRYWKSIYSTAKSANVKSKA